MQNDDTQVTQPDLLIHKRCKNHPLREAVARCPSCQSFFCRECITEHDHRVLCTQCLKALLHQQSKTSIPFKTIFSLCRLLIGFMMIWIVFYYTGRLLLLIPDSFHDGSFWKDVM